MKQKAAAKVGSMLIIFTLLSGCATVPMASIQDDALAKQFQPKPDKSLIYLFRNEIFGAAIALTVSIDGRTAGQTGPQTFYVWEVDPGKHQITSFAENVSNVWLWTEAGKDYYVWQEIKMGMFSARSVLKEVDGETGRAGVKECELIRSIN